MHLMKNIRTSIAEGRFPEFVRNYLDTLYPNKDVPKWVCNALAAVNIDLQDPQV
jgi:hypothetical protein